MGPLGDCRFDPDGDKLTITVPGKGHGLDIPQGDLHARGGAAALQCRSGPPSNLPEEAPV